MLPLLPNLAFSHTKCTGQTIAQTDTMCLILVFLTIRMNSSTQSPQPWRCMYFVGINITHSWPWGHNTHCWVFFNLVEKVNNGFPAGRSSWIRRTWFCEVQLKYTRGIDGVHPCQVLSRSFSSLCIYWTQMLWAWGMIPWLALVYCTLQSSSRSSTHVGLWHDWRYHNSAF